MTEHASRCVPVEGLPGKKITIRSMVESDSEQVARLCDQLGYPSSSDDVRGRFRVIMDDPAHDFCVAESPTGEVIGWIHLFFSTSMVSGMQAEVWGLVVDEAWRERGLGRRLMEHVEKRARGRGCRSLRLRTNVVRERAHTFYGRLGYRKVKTQHVFRKEIDRSREP